MKWLLRIAPIVIALLQLLAASCSSSDRSAPMTTTTGPGITGPGITGPGITGPATTGTSATAQGPPQIDYRQPNACAPCHGAVVAEWSESLHAHAHHSRDPVYAAVRAARAAREGEQVLTMCSGCHNPLDLANSESELASVGVGCLTCHGAAAVDLAHGKVGVAALELAPEGVMLGPHGVAEGTAGVHGHGPSPPHMKDGASLCMACHGELHTAAGLPQCTTGPEWKEGGNGATCVSCHMPQVNGPAGAAGGRPTHRSHNFAGPVRAWLHGDDNLIKSSVTLEGRLDAEGLRISIRNQSGHSFPSGFPGRMAVVLVTGYNEASEAIWKNIEEDPMTDDPDAVFNKVYVDAEGKPTLAPYAQTLARDNRLKPGETRTLNWPLPSDAVRAEVKVMFRLLPPTLAAALSLKDHTWASARPVAQKEFRRSF